MIRLLFSLRGALDWRHYLLATAIQTLSAFALVRVASPRLLVPDIPPPAPLLLALVLAACLLLFSMLSVAARRLSAKGLRRWHLLWIACLWAMTGLIGGGSDPLSWALAGANLVLFVWLAWPDSLRLRSPVPRLSRLSGSARGR